MGKVSPSVCTLVVLALLVAAEAPAWANSCNDNTPHLRNNCDNSRKVYTMWWFVNVIDAGAAYPTNLTLETDGYAGGYYWYLEGNTDAVRFDDGSTAKYTGIANFVTIVSVGPSTSKTGDVYLSWGNIYGYRSPKRRIVVKTPQKMKRQRTEIRGRNEERLWRTHIFYETRDQFNDVLPALIGHNEKWVGAESTNTPGGDNWERGRAKGGYNNPASWYDNINVPLSYANRTPPAVEPPRNGPYSTTKVDYWVGDWRCGSAQVGMGRPLQNGTGIIWQRYRDHANHE